MKIYKDITAEDKKTEIRLIKKEISKYNKIIIELNKCLKYLNNK